MQAKPGVDIITAMDDPKLFGSMFQGSSWDAWRTALKSMFAIPFSSPWEHELYHRCTGRSIIPKRQVREAWFPTGRRGGKSIIMALVAVYKACFVSYRGVLSPGERGMVVAVAADRQQARVVFRYIEALLDGSALLREMVLSKTRESISLRNRIDIEVHTSSFRSVRGYTVVAFIGDECAFWRTDDASANPDTEIVNAVRPAMATVPGALLLMISSPYARRGALWNTFKRHYGQNASTDVLVWQADSRTMNPTLPQSVIDKAFEEDEASASAEYGAQFRRDVETFIPIEVVEACTVDGRVELPPVSGTRYVGFVDPSGGSQDSFTAALAHLGKDGRVILDAIRERRPPFSPEGVVEEYAKFFASYQVHTVQGDRYAGEWPRERFEKHGITYEPNAEPKSAIYRDLLPLLNSQQVELLDVPRLAAQLAGLERRTSRSGKDTIDHAPRGHDDIINAAAGAIVEALALESRSGIGTFDYETGQILSGWDDDGNQWVDGLPHNGIFPPELDGKGRIKVHAARFVDGVLVEYVPAGGSVVQ